MGIRFRLSDDSFLVFCSVLEAERERAGAGPSMRMSVGQRADALQIILGLNRAGGWAVAGSDPEKLDPNMVFARHLAPVLCESPAMRGALDAVLGSYGLPGAFDPQLGKAKPAGAEIKTPERRGPHPFWSFLRSEFRRMWYRFTGVFWPRSWRTGMLLAGLLLVLAAGYMNRQTIICTVPSDPFSLKSRMACDLPVPIPKPDPNLFNSNSPVDWNQPGKQAIPRNPQNPGTMPSLGPLDRALTVLETANYDMPPMLLAQHLATASPINLDPALYLDAMLSRWPMKSDRPIPRSGAGALAVVNFALAIAELERDRGAAEAIRANMSGISDPAVVAVNVQGAYLPDLAPLEDADAPSLAFFARIDPRLARFAVDDVAASIFAEHLRQTTKIEPGQFPVLDETVIPNGQDFLRQPYDSSLLAAIDGEAQRRFGVSVRQPQNDAGGLNVLSAIAAVRADVQNAAPLVSSFEYRFEPWRRAYGFLPLAVPAFAFLWAVSSYRAALKRRIADWPRPPLPRFHLVVPAPDRDPIVSAMTRRVAKVLRHTSPLVTATLDVEASLSRTLAEGGYFTPVPRVRRNLAVHLVLIHRRTLDEHEPRRIAGLFGQMQTAGLSAVLYEYASDPSLLRPFGSLDATPRNLAGLLLEYPDARLILVTRGDEFAGTGAYGPSAATLSALLRWDARVVVTPVPVGNWGLREFTLSQRLQAPLARAGTDGLPDLMAAFPADTGRKEPTSALASGPPADWLRKTIARRAPDDPVPALPRLLSFSEADAALPEAPPPDRLEAIVLTLRRWLGPDGYLWLQACASYPALRYPLTRWLGSGLLGQGASARALAQLSLLGWFAVGRMPKPVAARLRRDLDDDKQARIHDLLRQFYASRESADASPAQDAGRSYSGDRVAYEPDLIATPLEAARLLPADMVPDAQAVADRAAAARSVVLADRVAVVAGASLLPLALWIVWPDRLALPLPPGAWLPALVVAVAWAGFCAAAAAVITALRRTRRFVGHAQARRGSPP